MLKADIIVIGGGASGMMAAISACEADPRARVVILEHTGQMGRKLLSTGNGKCNLTNRKQTPDCWRSSGGQLPWKIISQYPLQETLAFFRSLGLEFYERDGYIYPASGQAASVRDALLLKLRELGVLCFYGTEVSRLTRDRERGRFVLETGEGKMTAARVILACGSMAAPVTGSDGSGYRLAVGLGHELITPRPALVQLRCREKFYQRIAGVRVQAEVALTEVLHGGEERRIMLAEDEGEVQLTDYGISGIPVFQVSRYAVCALARKHTVFATLNFCPGHTGQDVFERLCARRDMLKQRSADTLLLGWFNAKLAGLLLQLADIDGGQSIGYLNDRKLRELSGLMTGFSTEITGSNDFQKAQVACGGISLREICPNTMESCLVPGLYLAGEMLDVDGICGGYNLQWAWSSGAIAGRSAAESGKAEEE